MGFLIIYAKDKKSHNCLRPTRGNEDETPNRRPPEQNQSYTIWILIFVDSKGAVIKAALFPPEFFLSQDKKNPDHAILNTIEWCFPFVVYFMSLCASHSPAGGKFVHKNQFVITKWLLLQDRKHKHDTVALVNSGTHYYIKNIPLAPRLTYFMVFPATNFVLKMHRKVDVIHSAHRRLQNFIIILLG